MKALKKIKVTEESILSSHQMSSVRGGSGSGSGGWEGDGYYRCHCQNAEESPWYEILNSMDSMYREIYDRCNQTLWGHCTRES